MDEEQEGNRIIELEFKAKERAAARQFDAKEAAELREHALKMAKVNRTGWQTGNVVGTISGVAGLMLLSSIFTCGAMEAAGDGVMVRSCKAELKEALRAK